LKEKTYVIDTNTILDDPDIVKKIKGKILIPTTVLQELDSKKFGGTEKNRNAREFARIADREEVEINYPESNDFNGNNDQKIIEIAKQQQERGEDVILVTNDIYMSILAKSKGIKTLKGEKKQYVSDEFYTGISATNDDVASVLDEYKPKYPNKYYITKSGILKHTKKGLNRIGRDKKIWVFRLVFI
jgi:predicted ribonuclease YlaK